MSSSGCLGALTGAAGSAVAKKAELRLMMKGKTAEQQRCIAFFLDNGGGGCLNSNGTGYSIEEYQQLVSQKCASLQLYRKAIEKISLDEDQIKEIDPIVLTSYRFDDDCLIKVDNNTVVSSQYSVSWIFFSQEQIFTYTYIFDTTSDNTWEFTNDYFYTDITAVEVSREVKEKVDTSVVSGCLGKKESVSKTNYVVDRLKIIVPGTTASFSMRNSETMYQSIQAAKAMIREKKYGK